MFVLAIPLVARGLPLSSLPTDTFQVGGLRRIPGGYVAVGRLLSRTFNGQDEVAIGEAGLIPFEALNVRFLDMFGLVDEDMARQPGGMHHRVHVDHLLARKPTAVLFAHLTVEPPYGPYQYGRELLASEKFHFHYRRVDIGTDLKDVGWALYLRRELDAKSYRLEWVPRDPFVERLSPTSK
jgi:hypothetical protein